MDINRYNTRVRQAMSDKYVECSKKIQENEKKILELRDKLHKYMHGNEALPYKEYTDISVSLVALERENEELAIRHSVWDEAREICLNIADEMRE